MLVFRWHHGTDHLVRDEFDVTIDQSDLTLENFGTIDAMASYLQRSQSKEGMGSPGQACLLHGVDPDLRFE